jgi:hypothetical protein
MFSDLCSIPLLRRAAELQGNLQGKNRTEQPKSSGMLSGPDPLLFIAVSPMVKLD